MQIFIVERKRESLHGLSWGRELRAAPGRSGFLHQGQRTDIGRNFGKRMGGPSRWCAAKTRGDASSVWVLSTRKRKDLASLYPKAEEQKGVGLFCWRRYGGGSCFRKVSETEGKGKVMETLVGQILREVVKQPCSNGEAVVRVKVDNRVLSQNLKKLAHCLVGCWDPKLGREDDLRSWGT
ncbi:hypothetical protein CK203_017163 [Vitis vinifera]|uniref:Uncharacterized protein n=1 Tax=Vitis vinifera TaxID=29760 RepID=A0A438JZT7_VITVI|nr:hypothetical protein CK203_017163 [Vitis vinifera]